MKPSFVLAEKVVAHLPGWVMRELPEGYECAEMVRESDGATIRVNAGGYRLDGRVEFRGCWPKYKDGSVYSGGPSEAITVTDKKTPEAMAKDILRRLLPVYGPKYAEAHAYVRGHEARSEEAMVTATRMAALIGAEAGENKCRRGDGVSIWNEPEPVRRLLVRPAYNGVLGVSPVSVDFEVHGLDPDTAAQVLMLIKEAEDRKAARASEVRVHVAPESVDEDEVEAEEPKRLRVVR